MNRRLVGKIKKLPQTPGVYLFKDSAGKVIYVGKAKNLKDRTAAYLGNDLGVKTQQMISQATDVEIVKVGSEVEALLLEAGLVRKHKSKYNIQLKDDKTPIYIGITRERFPRILLIRKTQLATFNLKRVFGPYLSAIVARRILKRIRKVFPFAEHKLGKKPCIYSQIGLCNPCPNTITTEKDRKKYLDNIKKTSATLSGRLTDVKRNLQREMDILANNEDYEGAQRIRDQSREMDLFTASFEQTADYLNNPNLLADIRSQELADLLKIITRFVSVPKLERIECFDVAHLAGAYPTASMVTFIAGEPDKRFYRHFKIKTTRKGDTDRLKEVFLRRKKHFVGWGVPDLIVVDGGRPQVSAALAVLGADIPVVGLAKRYETLVFKNAKGFADVRLTSSPAKNLVQRLRNEAHRFARRYHHQLVAKAIKKPLL